ncbi:MAG TPA: response regulator [Vicinamibacterales bacterium]|nr:response regulator [Vicinamibacterales bacterium]
MPRCLIVDDDRDGREGYAEYLRAFGFDVDECEDGESAWTRMKVQKPDILLVDLQLPGRSGWQLIADLRDTPAFAEMPIVAVSACVFPDDQKRAEEAGCSVFLPKPSVPGDVLSELRRLLKMRGPARQKAGMSNA